MSEKGMERDQEYRNGRKDDQERREGGERIQILHKQSEKRD